MEPFLGIVAIKAFAVVILAAGAALAGRYVKRPAVMHLLWIVVLLQLLTPPILEVGVIPPTGHWSSADRASALRPITAAASADTTNSADVGLPAKRGRSDWLLVAVLALWLSGTCGVLLLAIVRIRRFGRQLDRAVDAPATIQAAGERIAGRLGLPRCPRIRLVPARVSPILRPTLGSVEVLFPRELLPRLHPRERDALLAHELAHVRRKDHWVRQLELISGALFWWHPVVWWARAKLRKVEEQCCDGLVLTTLPDHAGDYAEGLLKTVEFLAGTRNRVPILASGAGEARTLEERLTMIMNHRSPRQLSAPQKWTLGLAAAALLLVFPTWADRASADPPILEAPAREVEQSEASVRESVLALERQAQALEQELRSVREQQRELQHSLVGERELVRVRRIEEQAQHRDTARLEYELARREQALARVDALAAAGELERVERLERELAETLVEAELSEVYRGRENRVRRLMEELEVLTRRRDNLETKGRSDVAAEIDEMIESLRLRLDEVSEVY